MKILVVDDEVLLVKGIKFNLESEGYSVDCCYDGEAAVNMARLRFGADSLAALTCVLTSFDALAVALDAFGRRKDAVGVTTPWLAEKLVELGASEAINLDGGNTTCMIFMGDVINRPEGTKEKNLRTVNGLIGVREGGE